jgi:hypothetical protein
MDQQDIETIASRENVPTWLVEFSQVWTKHIAVQSSEEYRDIKKLAQAINVPPFIVLLSVLMPRKEQWESDLERIVAYLLEREAIAEGTVNVSALSALLLFDG